MDRIWNLENCGSIWVFWLSKVDFLASRTRDGEKVLTVRLKHLEVRTFANQTTFWFVNNINSFLFVWSSSVLTGRVKFGEPWHLFLILQCKRKEEVVREIRSLEKNNVPVCIEVVLLPDCDSHDHKQDLTQGLGRGDFLLLEQWRFQVVPKRFQSFKIRLLQVITDR